MQNLNKSQNNILFQTANEAVQLRDLSSSQAYMGVPLHHHQDDVEFSSDTLLFQPEWDNHKTEEWKNWLENSILFFMISYGYRFERISTLEMLQSLDEPERIDLRRIFKSLKKMKSEFEFYYHLED